MTDTLFGIAAVAAIAYTVTDLVRRLDRWLDRKTGMTARWSPPRQAHRGRRR